MRKIDPVILHETYYVALFTLALSFLMETAFYIFGGFDLSVLLGNILGFFAGVLNFFLMGLTVQTSLGKPSDAAARQVRLSMTLRNLMLAAVMIVGAAFKSFNFLSLAMTLIFPSIAVKCRPLFIKDEGGEAGDGK